MARRTLLLIASILVAALGTALVWLYVQGAESRAQQGQALVPVLVMNGDAAASTPADDLAKLVVTRRVPTDVAVGALTSLQQVQGQHLEYQAVHGQLLLTAMFTNQASSGLPPEHAFVSISIAQPHQVPALLRPDTEVAVYSLDNGASRAATPRCIVGRVRVLTVGNQSDSPVDGAATVPPLIVGFDVTPQQGRDIIGIEAAGQPVLELLGKGTVAIGCPPL